MVESLSVIPQIKDMPAPPVGVIASLADGLEAVNHSLGLVLLPLGLDLFLWLGPRLSIYPLVRASLALLAAPAADAATQEGLALLRQAMDAAGRQFNLLALLSTAPLGVPSLMARLAPTTAPGRMPLVVQIADPLQYFLLILALNLAGLLLGAVYFGLLAQAVRETKLTAGQLFGRIWLYWLQVILFVVLVAVGLATLGAPLLLIGTLLAFVSPFGAGLAVLVGVTVGLWMLFYLAFAVHGVTLGGKNVFAAVAESVGMVMWNTPATYGLFLLILILSLGLSLVWTLPKPDSWMMVVGLVGHAYISTALAAATFVFYKDRRRWWVEIRAALAKRQTERLHSS